MFSPPWFFRLYCRNHIYHFLTEDFSCEVVGYFLNEKGCFYINSIVLYDYDKNGARLLRNVSWISTETFLMGNHVILFKCSRSQMFYKIGILKNFVKFTGRHLSRSLIFNKAASLRNATLLKKRLQHRCFPVNFAKLLKTPLFTEHLQ